MESGFMAALAFTGLASVVAPAWRSVSQPQVREEQEAWWPGLSHASGFSQNHQNRVSLSGIEGRKVTPIFP